MVFLPDFSSILLLMIFLVQIMLAILLYQIPILHFSYFHAYSLNHSAFAYKLYKVSLTSPVNYLALTNRLLNLLFFQQTAYPCLN